MIIGLAGLKRSGKSTIEKRLLSYPFNYLTYSFAHPIKLTLANLFNIDYNTLDSQITKEVNLNSPPFNTLDKPVTPRLLMTTLGTEWGRKLIHPNIWTELAKLHIDTDKNTLLSDIRFENEASLVRDLKGIVIHIRKEDNLLTDIKHLKPLRMLLSFLKLIHPSEVGINISSNDIILYNDSSIVALHKTIESIMSDIRLGDIKKHRTYYASDITFEQD